MKFESVRRYEAIFDNNGEVITFDKLDKIISIHRTNYKSGKITLDKYYKFFNNIEKFKKLCLEYWS